MSYAKIDFRKTNVKKICPFRFATEMQ